MQMKHLMSWHVLKTQQEVNQYAQSAKGGVAPGAKKQPHKLMRLPKCM